MQVAWRVKYWLEPLLYRTIVLADRWPTRELLKYYPCCLSPKLLSALRSRPTAFFSANVRHLYCGMTRQEAQMAALSACTGVENLWIESPKMSLISLLAPLTPKHLGVNLSLILHTFPPTHALFSQLTHLHILNPPHTGTDLDAMCMALSLIPKLTHLSLDRNRYNYLLPTFGLRVLETCRSLAVLVFCSAMICLGSVVRDMFKLVQDARFVNIYSRLNAPSSRGSPLPDWEIGVHGGEDHWRQAERIIEERRFGKIDRKGPRLNTISLLNAPNHSALISAV
ncbi:hypothetical protein DFH07DRAFT_1060656 [Mycena maculata]|uniref:Uncharacterized protein n=1 Tax=Mycena maculata TaxID=230809 RepID=A0AAD7NER4_9AGAR|nr:hypothetical protein DFH07DRAFT_1060656 [Mycena maculata]